MKQLLIMLALCFPTCLARKDNTRIFLNENSSSWRDPLKSSFSLFQNANKVSMVNRNIEAHANSELESQPVQSNLMVNLMYSAGSMVQVLMHFLLGQKNNKGELFARQQHRMKTYKHVYIIPTTPPQLQNDKFFHQGNTKSYLLRRTLRQRGKLLDPAETNGSVNNILRNLYAVVTFCKELLSHKYKSKIFEMFGNIFSRKASTYRRTSYKTSTYSKLVKKPSSRRITV